MDHDPARRTFLGFVIFGLGAILSAILGVPITFFVLDPRHRKAPPSEYKRVNGISLDELNPQSQPRQGVILDTRRDGWTLFPSDVVGRVWVVQVGARPANLETSEGLEAFNSNPAARNAYLQVFTTICPHLGCSVNFDDAGGDFLCPCHAARFTKDGTRVQPDHNPAARGMDTLEWQIDPTDVERNRLVVKYESYRATLAEKVLA